MKQKSDVAYYILLSIIAVFFLLILVYFGSYKKLIIDIYDRVLIGGLFSICCLFGISLAFYPSWYKKILKTRKNNLSKKNDKKILLKRKDSKRSANKTPVRRINHKLPK